jgi:IS1 family transposase
MSGKVVFGNPEKIRHILAESPVSENINTAYVERNNGTLRHIDARYVHKSFCFSKSKINHKRRLALNPA